ncbi:hypothetical protein IFT73_17740 [Aeromicrobium sp. CFBP 8757]|uniref:hypothetical protein n=1 Tax=Aeromicrobium sp. CFBP 8757 TaxID=2775288 RepID=UPI00177E8C6C|nr:hypothetical protein [Aeromicrobium sp. CFBP 8757]MBD8608701.1 hypothetical protein [Aeromicrobium sp. CFBP 8757]
MTTDLHLSGPTVTMFGTRDALDAALSDELGRRGCATHVVTTPMGWLSSVTNAVIRLDTVSGDRAMADLTSQRMPATHVVAVCATSDDEGLVARLDELCRQCGDQHDVSVIWHSPFGLPTEGLDGAILRASDLATTIADEIGLQEAWTSAPSYSSKTFEPGRHRGHP